MFGALRRRSLRGTTPGDVKHWLALAALYMGLVVLVGTWVSLDRLPPVWDHANHLERAVECHRILAEPGHDRLREILESSAFYPPIVPCAAGLLYFVFPATPLVAQSVMLGFLGLALVCLFLLGRRLFDATTGLVAAWIFAAAPFVVYSAINFQLDLPLAGAVSLALLVLVQTDGFSRRAWCAFLGLALAFGMLVKPPFAVYLAPPLAIVAWWALRGVDRRRRLTNLGLACLLGGVLSLPWYGPRLFGLPLQIASRSFRLAAEAGQPETLSAFSLSFYPRALVPMFGALAAGLFVWGLLALIRAPAARHLLWSASLVPFGVFLFIRNKDLRYVLPILPAASLIAAAGLRWVAPSWRRGVTVVLLGVSALQVSAAAFAAPRLAAWTPLSIPLVSSFPPSPVEWPHREILDVVAREARGRPATVSVVPNYNFFSVSNFRYYAVRDGLPLRLTRAWDPYPLGVDFVVLKTGNQGPGFTIAKSRRIMERLAGGDTAFERAFPVIWEGRLPDGSLGSVRQRRLTPLAGASPSALARRLKAGAVRFLEPYARDLEGLTVALAYTPEALLRGEVRRVHLEARSARVAEFSRNGAQLRLRDLRLTLDGLLVNPYRLADSGEIEPLGLEKLRLEHLVVTEEDLQAFLQGFRRLRGLRVGLEDGAVNVTVALPGPDVAGRLTLSNRSGNAPLEVHPEWVSLGGIPLPPLLLHWVFRHYDPTPRLANLPVAVELGRIRVEAHRIVISTSP